MTLTELTQEVYNLTGRADRVGETSSAIRAATLKCHQKDYFYKDIFETGLNFTTAEYIQNFYYKTLIPNWRALKYLRKLDITTNTPGTVLGIVLPMNVFDDYQIQKQDVCYVAGDVININSCTLEQNYLLGCYLNPIIASSGYKSWVADDHPYAIIFDAAATVFKAIGKDEEAGAYKILAGEQLDLVIASNIIAEGF